jgi:hypothetical protein
MKQAAHATGRGSATKLGSVVAPSVRINHVTSSRRKPPQCETPPIPTPRTLSANRHFRYYMDSRGFQNFNFQQRMTTALETLALNLLTYIARESGYRTRLGITSKRMVRLARRFCSECLLTASPEGWVIPRSAIEAWLASQQSLQVTPRNAIPARQRAQSDVARDKKLLIFYAKQSSIVRRTKRPAVSNFGRK